MASRKESGRAGMPAAQLPSALFQLHKGAELD